MTSAGSADHFNLCTGLESFIYFQPEKIFFSSSLYATGFIPGTCFTQVFLIEPQVRTSAVKMEGVREIKKWA